MAIEGMRLAAVVLAGVLVFVVAITVVPAQPAAAVTEARPPLKVVQLGDSYSAGNGARDASGDRNYTGPAKCYRSPTNWGGQYVSSLRGTFAVTYINRACSGGVIADITNERAFDPSNRIPFTDCGPAEYPDEEIWIEIDDFPLDKCQRKLRPQIEAVDLSVDLVLMTAGGNDAKFAEVVQQCFAVGYRDPGDCREAVTFARGQLQTIEDDLVDTFAALRARMRPDALIVLASYPYLVDDVEYRLRSLLGTDEYDAATEIRALGLQGDARQRNAVARANAAAGQDFVIYEDDIKSIFEGRAPNPVQSGDRNPDRWIYEFETRIPAEWYHYRPEGHAAIADTFGLNGGFGFGENPPDDNADLDIVFVVDTTGSMGDEIAQVRTDLAELVDQLASVTNSFRMAVVSYRDFPERTGNLSDYPARVDLAFSNDLASIQAAIDGLEANGGGDGPETVFSGLSAALDLSWRPGVSKVALVIGDAPPLSPEPISGLTVGELIAKSLAIDPVQVVGVDVGALDNGALTELAEGTGGSVEVGTGNLTETISDIIDARVVQPFAWVGGPYAAAVGEPIELDASGSYDPSGDAIVLYEWDFDGDGDFDLSTEDALVTHTYTEVLNGVVVVRVTGSGGSSLGSARIVVNELGSADQGDDDVCEADELGRPIIVDSDGRAASCQAEDLPTEDLPGVEVVTDDDPPMGQVDVAFSGSHASSIGVGGVSYRDEDIVGYDAEADAYFLVFDGSDVGAQRDVDAFVLLDDGSLLLSFGQPLYLDGIGRVDDSDVLRFVPVQLGDDTAGTFEWFLDGSDVGLSSPEEDIDALAVTPDGALLISTFGNARAGVAARPHDLLQLSDATFGQESEGTWSLYLDGSDVQLQKSSERLRGASVGDDGTIYLTTLGPVTVPGVSATGDDIIACVPLSLEPNGSACDYSAVWQQMVARYTDGIHVGPPSVLALE